jgi:hypothetical protein
VLWDVSETPSVFSIQMDERFDGENGETRRALAFCERHSHEGVGRFWPAEAPLAEMQRDVEVCCRLHQNGDPAPENYREYLRHKLRQAARTLPADDQNNSFSGNR